MDQSHKMNELKEAAKAFEDCLRASNGQNMMALLGKARTQFSMSRYADAYKTYQAVLQKAPDLIEPDPRIGIGCCLWQLGFKEDAKVAWERAWEISQESKAALILLGLYHMYQSSQFSANNVKFRKSYTRAITEYVQRAYKIDNDQPMAKVLIGAYLLPRDMSKADNAAMKAIELTDVNAIISDGWYLRGRKAHSEQEYKAAADYYSRSDLARGGDEQGYLPAKLGLVQLRILQKDYDGAKFRLEKIVHQSRSPEAMSLLGALFAQDVFNGMPAATKEEIASTVKKAVSLLETVRLSWKDPNKHVESDMGVLFTLARLYEGESPEKALKCLHQAEHIEVTQFERDEDDDEEEWLTGVKERLSPQLTNNIGCYYYQSEKYAEAQEYFQYAASACTNLRDEDKDVDPDALITTISFNLGRTYEAQGLRDQAKEVYEGVVARHGYIDARLRLTYLALTTKKDDGPKAMKKLYESEPNNMDVRALYGWFLRKAKKQGLDPAMDAEQRHYKHTLQNHDKNDQYSLTAMGNFYLQGAREKRGTTDKEKGDRMSRYDQAVAFFDKVLSLDSCNAYAAQGIAIAMAEDLRDTTGALHTFLKVRDTIKDFSVFLNLGHLYSELQQYSRAIESYEAALSRTPPMKPTATSDAEENETNQRENRENFDRHTVLACLGRAWLLRGQTEKSRSGEKDRSVPSFMMALQFSREALEIDKRNPNNQYNVAYIQHQIAQHLNYVKEQERSTEQMGQALADLDAANESFETLGKSHQPPKPRDHLEQRATMGRNTLRKQLERNIQKQKEYEENNAERLAKAKHAREKEMKRREEENRRLEAEEEERRQKIAAERKAMQERDREIAAQREEDERRAREEEEPELDEQGNVIDKKGKKKKSAKRKKKSEDFINDEDDLGAEGSEPTPAASGEERPRKKKKRRTEKKGRSSKYKSEDFINDSDEDLVAENTQSAPEQMDTADDELFGDDEDVNKSEAAVESAVPKKRGKRVIDDEDDEDEEMDADGVVAAGSPDGAMPLEPATVDGGDEEEEGE